MGEGDKATTVNGLSGVLLEDVGTDLKRLFKVGKHNAIGTMNDKASRILVADGCTAHLWGGLDLKPGWQAPREYVLKGSSTPTKDGYMAFVPGGSTFPNNSITSLEVKCDLHAFCNQLVAIATPACRSHCMPHDSKCDDAHKIAHCAAVLKDTSATREDIDACLCINSGPGDASKDPSGNNDPTKDPAYLAEVKMDTENAGNKYCWSSRCRDASMTNPDTTRWQLNKWVGPDALRACKVASLCTVQIDGADINNHGGRLVVKDSCGGLKTPAPAPAPSSSSGVSPPPATIPPPAPSPTTPKTSAPPPATTPPPAPSPSAPAPPPPPPPADDLAPSPTATSAGLSTGAIVGIVFGVLVLFIMLILLLALRPRKVSASASQQLRI